MTSFITLSPPAYNSDSTSATIEIADAGLNPQACRDTLGLSMGGFIQRAYEARLSAGTWRVSSLPGGMSGTTVCGHYPPAEQALHDRWDREDSTVLHTPFPFAGTYQFTLTSL
jgi:hypothetical protein